MNRGSKMTPGTSRFIKFGFEMADIWRWEVIGQK
jgi:hypothetical protein